MQTHTYIYIYIHPTDRIAHTTVFVTPVVEHWLEQEIAQCVHHEGSIRRPIETQIAGLRSTPMVLWWCKTTAVYKERLYQGSRCGWGVYTTVASSNKHELCCYHYPHSRSILDNTQFIEWALNQTHCKQLVNDDSNKSEKTDGCTP